MAIYSDNIDEVSRFWDAAAPAPSHYIEFENAMDYAAALHAKTGYYLFNDPIAVQFVAEAIAEAIQSGKTLTDETIEFLLDVAGYRYIAFLREKTSVMRPPIKLGQGMRRAYQGGWSDITGNLAGAFTHSVDGHNKITHQ